MNDKSFLGLFRALGPKLTRWDAVSLILFTILAFVAKEGCKVIVSLQFTQLIILLAVLFGLAFLLLFIEIALKRLA